MKASSLPIFICGLILTLGLFSCASIPEGARAVTNFELNRYLGKWYEIARLDFKFEEGLDNTTAEYSLNKNGTVKVDNKGRRTETGEREQAIGKAKFAGDTDVGMLKVSFFGPFYSGYNVIMLDDYQHTLVAGANLKYLWILSRTPSIPDEVKERYLAKAKELGYQIEDLVWVQHGE